MCGRRAVLDAADMQVCGLEVDLLPPEIADLGGAQSVLYGAAGATSSFPTKRMA